MSYKKTKEAAAFFDLSLSTMKRLEQDMRRYIGTVYPATVITNRPKRWNLAAIRHFTTYRQQIQTGGYYPPFTDEI